MLSINYSASSLTQHQETFISFLEETEQQEALTKKALQPSLVMTQFHIAHQQVIHKLINALLREQIMELQGNLLIWHGTGPQDKRVWRIDGLKCFSSGEVMSLEQVITFTQEKVISCIELIAPLSKLFNSIKFKEFRQDLQQTWFNTALALAYRLVWGKELDAKNQKNKNLWHYLSQLNISQAYSFLEQWAAVGHPSHPTDRSKPDLDLSQILSYSPDFNANVNLILGALKTDHVSTDSMIKGEAISPTDIRIYWHEYFPSQMKIWQEELKKTGLNAQNYLPIPIHPWQAKYSLPTLFNNELQQKTLVLFENITIKTLPTLSFRSMLPLSNRAPCLKVPVAIKMTSAKRLLSVRSAHMGPRFSSLMKQLLNKLPQVEEYFSLQPEDIGLHYQSPTQPNDQLASHLSYICRQNACNSAKPDEIMLPAASLLAPDIQGKPLWLSILQHQGNEDWSAAMKQLAQYSKVLCHGPLAFYLHTGIGLEVHQQNTVLVCNQQGNIKRCLTRDFGAFRIYLPQFNTIGLPLEFHHDNRLQTKDPAQARNRLVHAMLISQLGEYIKSLINHYQLESKQAEAQAWRIVKESINSIVSSLTNQLDHQWLEQEKHALLNDPWPMKALMRMRLQSSDSYIYYSTDNPLEKV